MKFADRRQAGRLLAPKLAEYTDESGALVLGLPRGGVVVADEVAKALRLPLDAWVVRKLGFPGEPELAMGAIASGDSTVMNRDMIRSFQVSETSLHEVVNVEKRELVRREIIYRGGLPLPAVTGKAVIVVDDGVATGYTFLAALKAIRERNPRELVAAAPVGSPQSIDRLGDVADRVFCLRTPDDFMGVGQWYDSFEPVSDKEVIEILSQSHIGRSTRLLGKV
ncbi:MAG: hypothetical protein A2901_02110 [Elusimicrobia bacterium RIFCSPLOWO2_01_FULL_54_10]|nr:MAG: hypothetical protein A2901_02110 [Elusimicrobia bacterium RIFCSPLOWO2_01_FULL_54_10]